MNNLDPKWLKVKQSGWSAEDRARNLLDIWNRESEKSTPWKYSDLVYKTFPGKGTHDFVEGFLLAGLFMAEAITGGKVRDHIRNRDHGGDIDPLMMQRFLSWIETQMDVRP